MLQIFVDLDGDEVPGQQEQERRSQQRRTRLKRWRVSVETSCREHHTQGTAFVSNHVRDVARASDLLGAIAGSLDGRQLLMEDEERIRLRRLEEREERTDRLKDDEEIEIRSRYGEVMRSYLQLLVRFLPRLHQDDRTEFRLRSYLSELEEFAANTPPSSFSLRRFLLSESSLRSRLDPFDKGESSSVESWSWVGCRDGRFPCALWQLFHVLTVEQAHQWKWDETEQVLRTGISTGHLMNVLGTARSMCVQ